MPALRAATDLIKRATAGWRIYRFAALAQIGTSTPSGHAIQSCLNCAARHALILTAHCMAAGSVAAAYVNGAFGFWKVLMRFVRPVSCVLIAQGVQVVAMQMHF